MLFHFGAPFDQGGFLGVDAFFVLSGFLITALLIEEWSRTGGIAFRRFYTRRALRLLPALFAMLLLVTVVVALIAPRDVQEATWRGTVVTLLYAANWQKVFSSQSVGLLGHTWSLSIEEQFYVLWPPLLLLLLRHRLSLHWLTLVAAVLAVASASTRALMMMSGAHTTEVLYNALQTRADALLIGCAAALAVASGIVPHRPWPLSLRVLVGTALPLALCLCFEKARSDAPPMYYAGFLLFACAVAVLIVGLVAGRTTNLALQSPPLVWIGARSYGLYLWHLPVHEILKILGVASSWRLLPYLVLNLGVSLLLAGLSYRVIETPALNLKRRFAPAEAVETRPAAQPTAVLEPVPAEPAYAWARVK
jgi:peptidoglycan/LPS O-acetylase OafA/YrhL